MHKFLSFNGKIHQTLDAQIPAVSSAALYGRGIFTTIAIYHGKPFLWHLHERRLRDNAARVGLYISELSFEDLRNQLLELITVNKIDNGRSRITLFDSGSSEVWKFSEERKTEILITTAERRETAEAGLNLTVSPFRVNSASPLAGVKSCNYLEKLITLEDARAHGFGEAVCANERGEVVSAVMTNIFWIKDDKIYTPSLETGALAGTTREFVIDLAKEHNFEVIETIVRIEDLENADEVFLTSTGLSICSAQSLESKIYQNSLTQKLQKTFLDSTNI